MNLQTLFKRIVLAVALGIGMIVLYIVWVLATSDDLPSVADLENPRQELATQILSADGELLEYFATTRRTYLPFDSIPQPFINALIATEDRAFYDHWGVHALRIAKAAVKNVFALRAKEGASTITQQLALNLYFKRERTLARKIREAYTAFQIEQTYTKNEILEMYANTVYYGKGAYGIREAAYTYFGKQPRQLSLAECAYLVGLFKAPERYNRNDEEGIGRRNLILQMMLDEDMITEKMCGVAQEEPLLRFTPESIGGGIAPHFVEMIRQRLSPRGEWNDLLDGRDLYRDGLVIHTTIDARVQRYANQAVAEHLLQYQSLFDQQWNWSTRSETLKAILVRAAQQHPEYLSAARGQRAAVRDRLLQRRSFVDSVKTIATTIQTGVVVIDARTGGIVAMVGASPRAMQLDRAGRYSLNHVTQIRRQPGSAFKPFVYVAALEQGMSPDDLVESGPFSIILPETGELWAPKGASSDGGPIPLRRALKFSTNTVAARLVTGVTSPLGVIDICRRMGITSPLTAVPSIALGATEVTPLELVTAYVPFATQGVAIPTATITKIEDRFGNILYQARLPHEVRDAISASIANNMVSMMQGVVDGGTASSIRQYYQGPAAGKTGTTNDFADAWFVGLTPQLVCGVWTGFDDRRVTFTGDYGQGGRAAAPVWGRLMGKVYADKTLPYNTMQFETRADSIDIITPDLIANPPSDQVRDIDSIRRDSASSPASPNQPRSQR